VTLQQQLKKKVQKYGDQRGGLSKEETTLGGGDGKKKSLN